MELMTCMWNPKSNDKEEIVIMAETIWKRWKGFMLNGEGYGGK